MRFASTDKLDDEPLRSPREDEQLPTNTPVSPTPGEPVPLDSPRDLKERPPNTVDVPPDETDEPLDSFRD